MMGAFSHNLTQALLGFAAAVVVLAGAAAFTADAAGADCTFLGAALALSWAMAAEADIATVIAKAEASALPLVRNSAFPINVKILACLQAGAPALPLVAAQMF
jgi:hypothetical protein